MKIIVKQGVFGLFGRRFNVYIDGEKTYRFKQKAFELKLAYRIKNLKTNEVLGSINYKILRLAPSKIQIGSSEYLFQKESFRSAKYHCSNKNNINEKLLIQSHYGHSYSIFKNKVMVAWWKKNKFIVLEGHRFEIEANNDENPILLSAFTILVNRRRNFLVLGGDIGWDQGNTEKRLTDLDQDWAPK